VVEAAACLILHLQDEVELPLRLVQEVGNAVPALRYVQLVALATWQAANALIYGRSRDRRPALSCWAACAGGVRCPDGGGLSPCGFVAP